MQAQYPLLMAVQEGSIPSPLLVSHPVACSPTVAQNLRKRLEKEQDGETRSPLNAGRGGVAGYVR